MPERRGPDRDATIRKVRSLLAKTTEAGASPEEAQAALELATRLRLRHGISDADLENAAADEEDVVIFGSRLFHYSRSILPHLQTIQNEIDRALAKADKTEIQERMALYCRFYKDLREMVEGSTYFKRVKQRRNEVIKEYYQAQARWYQEQFPGPDDISVHRHARDWTAMYGDIRKDTVERIVDRFEDRMIMDQCRDQTCVICGLNGRDGRAMPTVEIINGETEWVHPACLPSKDVVSDAPEPSPCTCRKVKRVVGRSKTVIETIVTPNCPVHEGWA